MSGEPVTFLATIRPIQSALSVSGNNEGARLTLDIPETELPAIARLLLLRGVVLRVTVEEETYGAKVDDCAGASRSGAGRPSGGRAAGGGRSAPRD